MGAICHRHVAEASAKAVEFPWRNNFVPLLFYENKSDTTKSNRNELVDNFQWRGHRKWRHP